MLTLEGARGQTPEVAARMDEVAARTDEVAAWTDEVAARTDEVATWTDEVAARTDEVAAWTDEIAMRTNKVAARRGQGCVERSKNREKSSVSSTRKDESDTHQPGPCSRSRHIPTPSIRITARAHRMRGLNNLV